MEKGSVREGPVGRSSVGRGTEREKDILGSGDKVEPAIVVADDENDNEERKQILCNNQFLCLGVSRECPRKILRAEAVNLQVKSESV